MDCPSNVLSWIWEDNMTDEEKTAHPEYQVTGGFLKHIEKETGRQMWWDGLSDEQKDIVMQLPNGNRNSISNSITERIWNADFLNRMLDVFINPNDK